MVILVGFGASRSLLRTAKVKLEKVFICEATLIIVVRTVCGHSRL